MLKEPYDLEFLGLTGDADERATESGIVARIQRFLLELGVGFAFIGRQARISAARSAVKPRRQVVQNTGSAKGTFSGGRLIGRAREADEHE